MENQTAFDLNHAIQNWRESLAQSPALRSENLNELESHLRDSVATLQTRDLSAEEAFIIAIKRIGKNTTLEKEFGKINGGAVWLDRCLWILLAFQTWFIILHISSLAQNIMLRAGLEFNEILPGFGWQKIPLNYLLTFLSTIFSQVPIALALGFTAWHLVRRRQETIEIFIQKLSRRPMMLAGGIFAAGVVSQIFATVAFQWIVPRIFYQHISPVWPARLLILEFSVAAFWAWLTLLVARKRLRAGTA